ncbi:hypothetical protein T11_7541 [Trichinella zimbabwensis]|uniref:Uncharacterized protein n=1 Tax=Trichinella zimbabwensis TaxID=268475 RepID=A0A0V1I4C7_9BILA|nr:hypothetical protein T11_7541 [Trichinella zimbabwensis]
MGFQNSPIDPKGSISTTLATPGLNVSAEKSFLSTYPSNTSSPSTPSSCHDYGGQLLATRQNEISLTVRLSKSTQPHRPSDCATNLVTESLFRD